MDSDEREAARLWRVFKTVHEMVKDRVTLITHPQGFVVSKAELELSLDDFKGSFLKGGVIEYVLMADDQVDLA